jgi:hypothetical protein
VGRQAVALPAGVVETISDACRAGTTILRTGKRIQRAARRLRWLLPVAAWLAVFTLPFTVGIESLCAWNFVQFNYACYEGNTAMTVAFMVILSPLPAVGLLFVFSRFVTAISDRFSG